MKIETQHNIGDTVYIKTDRDQKERIITAIYIRGNNLITYVTTCCGEEVWCYEFEISAEKDILKYLTESGNE